MAERKRERAKTSGTPASIREALKKATDVGALRAAPQINVHLRNDAGDRPHEYREDHL